MTCVSFVDPYNTSLAATTGSHDRNGNYNPDTLLRISNSPEYRHEMESNISIPL